MATCSCTADRRRHRPSALNRRAALSCARACRVDPWAAAPSSRRPRIPPFRDGARGSEASAPAVANRAPSGRKVFQFAAGASIASGLESRCRSRMTSLAASRRGLVVAPCWPLRLRRRSFTAPRAPPMNAPQPIEGIGGRDPRTVESAARGTSSVRTRMGDGLAGANNSCGTGIRIADERP